MNAPLHPAPTALRSYQIEAVEHVLTAHARRERSGIVALPTGSGKTLVASEVLRRLPGRALVVVHTSLLGAQIRGAIASYLGEPVGLVADGKSDLEDSRIVVGLRQSLTPARLESLIVPRPFEPSPSAVGRGKKRSLEIHVLPPPPSASPIPGTGSDVSVVPLRPFGVTPFATLVIDEAHHASESSTYETIRNTLREKNPDLFTLGLTATPWRETGALLFERWWFSREIADMVSLDVLASVQYARIHLPLDLRHARLTGGDYAAKALEPKLIAIATATVERVAPLVVDRSHVVAFAITVKHAQALTSAFERVGVSATCIWGAQKPGARDESLRLWRAGKTRVLVNVGIVTEGFDEPRIGAIVFARPTASTLFYLQALGRGLRKAPGKIDCLVVDCVGLDALQDMRQCTLDAIVPQVAALGMPLGAGGGNAPEYKGRRVVCGPNDDAVHVWKNLAPDTFGLDIGRDEGRNAQWIVVRRNGASGLYDATLIDAFGRHVEAWREGPFSVIVEHVRDRLRGTKGVFGVRRAKWRQERATPKQFEILGRFDALLATQALLDRWKRGRVSDAIAVTFGRRLAHRAGLLKGVTPNRSVA